MSKLDSPISFKSPRNSLVHESHAFRIQVLVRLRPAANSKESTSVVAFKAPNHVILSNNNAQKPESRSFGFDEIQWSFDPVNLPPDIPFASQSRVFETAVVPLIQHAFKGFNTCVFAYGQTGSGKSHTMMGTKDDPGIIPRVGNEVFSRIKKSDPATKYTVSVSYFEIYNHDKIKNLLDPKTTASLKVREHPQRGPYVEGLTSLTINSPAELYAILAEGNKHRSVASTALNDASSRSHAIFTVTLTQIITLSKNNTTEKISRMHLVDLAGSERSKDANTSGARLKEGSEINRSLTTLGRVITALVEKSQSKSKHILVPYRDSTLTWVLKEALGGNSMTTMIATISPSPANYDHTLSTLRFATNVKKIENVAIVNEDPTTALIRSLREEIDRLQGTLSQRPPASEVDLEKIELREKLSATEKQLEKVNQEWQEKLEKAKDHQDDFKALGILSDPGLYDISAPSTPRPTSLKKLPYLMNLTEDPNASEFFTHTLQLGTTTVGSGNADLKLRGQPILEEHCFFTTELDSVENTYTVKLHPCKGALVTLNGETITSPTLLHSSSRVVLGSMYVFRFFNPMPSQQHRPINSPLVAKMKKEKVRSRRESGSLLEDSEIDSLDDHVFEGLYNRVVKSKQFRTSSMSSNSSRPEFFSPVATPPPRFLSPGPHQPSSHLRRLSRDSESVFSDDVTFYAFGDTPSKQASEQQQQQLAKKYTRKWKRQKEVWFVHQLLESLIHVKRAQITAMIFNLSVDQFQLMVIDDTGIQLSPYDDDEGALTSSSPSKAKFIIPPIQAGYCDKQLAIRFFNPDTELIHICSVANAERIVPQVNNLKALRDIVLSSKTPNYIELTAPYVSSRFPKRFSYVGKAEVPWPSASGKVLLIDVTSPYTYSVTGLIKLISVGGTSRYSIELGGMSPEEVIDVHCGVSIVKRRTAQEDDDFHKDQISVMVEPLLVTPVMQLQTQKGSLATVGSFIRFPSYFELPEIDSNAKVFSYSLLFEVHGTTRTKYLERLMSWDDMQEENLSIAQELEQEKQDLDTAAFPVTVNLQILEMDERGDYVPAQVVAYKPFATSQPATIVTADDSLDTYTLLHQGVQRRIRFEIITPEHIFEDAGNIAVNVHDLKLIDVFGMIVNESEYYGAGRRYANGKASDGEPPRVVGLKIIGKPSVDTQYMGGGFHRVRVECQWDTSEHSSKLLNHTTRENSLVQVQLGLKINVQNQQQLSFRFGVNVSIKPRASGTIWSVLFGRDTGNRTAVAGECSDDENETGSQSASKSTTNSIIFRVYRGWAGVPQNFADYRVMDSARKTHVPGEDVLVVEVESNRVVDSDSPDNKQGENGPLLESAEIETSVEGNANTTPDKSLHRVWKHRGVSLISEFWRFQKQKEHSLQLQDEDETSTLSEQDRLALQEIRAKLCNTKPQQQERESGAASPPSHGARAQWEAFSHGKRRLEALPQLVPYDDGSSVESGHTAHSRVPCFFAYRQDQLQQRRQQEGAYVDSKTPFEEGGFPLSASGEGPHMRHGGIPVAEFGVVSKVCGAAINCEAGKVENSKDKAPNDYSRAFSNISSLHNSNATKDGSTAFRTPGPAMLMLYGAQYAELQGARGNTLLSFDRRFWQVHVPSGTKDFVELKYLRRFSGEETTVKLEIEHQKQQQSSYYIALARRLLLGDR